MAYIHYLQQTLTFVILIKFYHILLLSIPSDKYSLLLLYQIIFQFFIYYLQSSMVLNQIEESFIHFNTIYIFKFN